MNLRDRTERADFPRCPRPPPVISNEAGRLRYTAHAPTVISNGASRLRYTVHAPTVISNGASRLFLPASLPRTGPLALTEISLASFSCRLTLPSLLIVLG